MQLEQQQRQHLQQLLQLGEEENLFRTEVNSLKAELDRLGTEKADFARQGPVSRERINNIRRTTSQHMSLSWQTIPHVTVFDKADITELEELRQRFKGKAEAAGGKLTITAMMLKLVASALRAFPKLNASLDTQNNQVVTKHYYHVGVAADTDRGLVVPVVRDVDRKNMIQLAAELVSLARKARDGKLTPDEMQGGTFTITNLGGLGIGFFTPIVNFPQVAILGLGRAVMEPVWLEDEFQPRLMLPLSLSFDHRLVDGADGARFLRWIVDAIEQPLLIALEG
ncbi:MAG: 2-oxo acid dehydrogenase subunit E2 [Armatimonadetes bacterium]|nr:2-oxo acid dehydrogenase subunit E2 [Armatimonadota bacterium]